MNTAADAAQGKMGLVLLGASQFPNFPPERHLDNPSFGNSARAFQNVIQDGDVLLSGRPTVLDLFDSDLTPQEIIKRIRDFLRAEANITDLVLYYCGHGSFLSDRTYFLMIRATEPDSEAFTGLPWRQMRHTLEPHLANRRVYIVLDCCFAGRAITEFQSAALGPLIEEQTFHALPRRGTALVAASAHGDVAIAPGERSLTMFTGALVEAIEHGLQGRARTLSLRDVVMGIRHRLPELYPGRAVLPQIHDPVQPEGDVSATPLFINRAFQPPKEPDATAAEREMFEFAVSDLGRPLSGTRLAAMATLVGLIESTKSRPFREKMLEQIRKTEAEDDSRAVVARATEILQRFTTLAEVSAVVRASEPPVVAARAVVPRDGLQQSIDRGELQQSRVITESVEPLNTGKDAVPEAVILALSEKPRAPTRLTFSEALKGISKWDLLAYGIAPGFVAGIVVLIISKQSNTETPLVLWLELGVLIAAATISGYVWSARRSLPTLASVTSLVVFGLAMSLCEATAITWLFEFPEFPHVIFRTVQLSLPFTLLGWALFKGWGRLMRFGDLKG